MLRERSGGRRILISSVRKEGVGVWWEAQEEWCVVVPRRRRGGLRVIEPEVTFRVYCRRVVSMRKVRPPFWFDREPRETTSLWA